MHICDYLPTMKPQHQNHLAKEYILKNNYCLIPLRVASQSSRTHKDKKKNSSYWGWEGGGNGELLLNGYKGLVLQDEKSMGDGEWGCLHNDMNILNYSHWTVYLKMIKMVKFIYTFPQ